MKIEKEVNPHFEDFLFDWNEKFQFLVGGYGSSKSYHVALKILLKGLEEKRTMLVVRNVFGTLKDSCYSLFEEIASDLGIREKMTFTKSPLEVKFPNGSKIIFRGLDDKEKLKSIHNVSLIWMEECSEGKYEAFKELIGRLRHPTLRLHFILSTNPIGEDNWSYKHFFMDEENEIYILDDERLYKERTIVVKDTYYHHSTADDNLFLPLSYIEQLDEMEIYDPDLHRVARLGRFGINGIKVLPQFETKAHFEVMSRVNKIDEKFKRIGLDWGFENSYNALLRVAIDDREKILYIYYEYYKNKQTDDKTVKDLIEFRESQELIRADSEDPKAIRYFNQEGFRMTGAKKFPGSRLSNTRKMKRFKRIVCSDNCKNTVRELKNLTYKKDRKGELIYDDFNIDPHTFEAIWYALDGYEVANIKEKANERPKGVRRK